MKKKHPETNVTGIIFITQKGVGFLEALGPDEDIEIRKENLNTALHGDTVSVSLLPKVRGKRASGRVDGVIKRSKTTFVGTVIKSDGVFLLEPDDRRMYAHIVLSKTKALKENTKVVVSMLPWKNPENPPKGEVLEILGEKGVHDVEMRAIVAGHGFGASFPKDVEREAKKLSKKISTEEIKKRRDMRKVPTYTIDPKTAKDFDDALSIEKLSDGNYSIGIHIADVSHYVKRNSAIDREAQNRATSIYLVDRTIPMLPEKLSNDICSLNPNEDRLAFSAIFTLDNAGRIKKRWFGETVIHSDKRFSYEEAQKVLDSNKSNYAKKLKKLNEIAKSLRKKRFAHGAVDFDQDEVGFELDKNGKVVSIYKKERLGTNKLIEEFMLLANREVAHYMQNQKIGGKNRAFIYRVHDLPDPDKIEELSIFLKALGYELKAHREMVSAKDINALFKKISDTPEEQLIKTATIRSMAKAVYSTKNAGHFGLAFTHYTHFTSPIRRYPDILVHRAMKERLEGKPMDKNTFSHYEKMAIQSTAREIEAVQAERDSIKYKQVEYMQEKIGEMFDGVISGVTEWGLYVEESETRAEGLVHISRLGGDYYVLDKTHYRLVGEKSKKRHRLGDGVRVRLISADLDRRALDFELV